MTTYYMDRAIEDLARVANSQYWSIGTELHDLRLAAIAASRGESPQRQVRQSVARHGTNHPPVLRSAMARAIATIVHF